MQRKTLDLLLAGFCLLAVVPSLFLLGCRQRPGEEELAFIAKVDAWHVQRLDRLTAEQSWLSLAGLFWLHPGVNRFGSDTENDFQFPGENVPARIGSITLQGNRLQFSAAPGVAVLSDGQPVTRVDLRSDADGEATALDLGSLRWIVIKRGDRYAVRLWDSKNPRRLQFSGIERFPVQSSWRIPARFEAYEPPHSLTITTAIGTVSEERCPGALVFDFAGQAVRLDAVAEPEDATLFVVFADQTSGKETYGGGRFLVVQRPDSSGGTMVDFNRAFNPPCAFSPFATCPLPPKQNRLSFAVTAGEKIASHD